MVVIAIDVRVVCGLLPGFGLKILLEFLWAALAVYISVSRNSALDLSSVRYIE